MLADDRPGAVRLLAGASGRGLRAPIDEDLLRVVRAAEAVRVSVVIADAELAVMAVVRIAPLILAVGPACREALVIGLVGVAPVVAIHALGESRTDGAAGDHAADRGDSLAAPARTRIAGQPADHTSGQAPARLH